METESKPTEQADSPKAPVKKANPKQTLTIAGFVVIVAALGAALYIQHSNLHDTTAKNAKLASQVKELNASNSDLKSKNSTLSKSVAALSAEQTKITKPAQPSATASLAISKVLIVTPSYFGNTTSPTADTEQLRAVFVTMTNLSSTSQTYQPADFTATTDAGEIVHPILWGPLSGDVWYQSTLAPNASTTQAITFHASDNLVTLQWKPAGSDAITLTIPAAN